MWLLPVKYSLFNGLFVAFGCCLILYLVAIETKEKKAIRLQLKTYTDKTIWNMSDEELSEYLQSKDIRPERQEFVKLILKGWSYSQISLQLGYSVDTLKDWSPKLKEKLKIKSWKQEKN